jgi:hypothetical protein
MAGDIGNTAVASKAQRTNDDFAESTCCHGGQYFTQENGRPDGGSGLNLLGKRPNGLSCKWTAA